MSILIKNPGAVVGNVGEAKSYTYTVDSFDHGIAWGQHHLEGNQEPRDFYMLRIGDRAGFLKLRSRYALSASNPFQELERHLKRISRQGVLQRSTIYFGVSTDPFHPFAGKFDASIKFLELFKRYRPGRLIVQTRSPLVIIALPVFAALGNKVLLTIGVETNRDSVVARYTPDLPRAGERLKLCNALRNCGVKVAIQVSPVLPYGDWRRDAGTFAEEIAAHADYVHIRPIHADLQTRGTRRDTILQGIGKKLELDRQFFYLRSDSAKPLQEALEKCAPEKLLPLPAVPSDKQLSMFAA